jgi:hypothetical protein
MARMNKAKSNYLKRFMPFMTGYVLILLGVTWLFNHAPPTGYLRYVAAIAPALPLLGVIWAMGRYLLEEPDEYVRMYAARTYLWATGLTLAVCTIWGFLENLAGAPHAPLFLVFPLFCACLGAVQGFDKLTGRV